MPIYKYNAKDKLGAALSGTLEGISETEVSEILHKQDLIVISVELAKKGRVARAGGKIKPDDLVIFSRQLATMIDAGIPLVQCLSILAEQIDNPSLRNVVAAVRHDIVGGINFCDALTKHSAVFSPLFINMARAGEASGMLSVTLDRLAAYLEKTASINRKIKSSLMYPAVVVTIAILITSVLLLKIVPTFKGIFDTLGGDLPLPTKVLIFASDLLRRYFLFVLAVLVLAAIGFKRYIKTERGQYYFDKQKLKVPVLGELLRKVALAKFSRTFSTLVKSGVPVLNALDIVAVTCGNKVVEEAIIACRNSVREGETIYKPLSRSGVFPPMVCRMVSVGEQTGQLEKMLSKIADFYDEQVDAAVSALTSMIEPIIIVFLGVVIGGIVVALFMPIFKITELVSK